MLIKTINIQKFDTHNATEKEWDDATTLWQAFYKEREPGDPVSPKEILRRDIEVASESKRNQFDLWLVYDETQTQAIAWANTRRMTPMADDYSKKKHLVSINMFVQPDYRRQGIGSQLLEHIAKDLQNDNRTLMEVWVASPAGDAFMSHWNAKVALQMKTNRLLLADLDWDMLEQWVKEGQERNPDVQLVMTDALPPDHMLQSFANLIMDIFAQMPKEDADSFPEIITVESLRERDEQMRKQNYTELSGYTVEKNGVISAMTSTMYRPASGHSIHQGLTGVHIDYRGHGLGKWLKAAMLLEIRERYPNVKHIDTHNANVNAPMLYINEKLGFKFHHQNTTYQLQVATVLEK